MRYKHVRGGDVWWDDNPVGSEPQPELHPTIRPPVYFDIHRLRERVTAYQDALTANHANPTIPTYRAVADTRERLMERVTPEIVCVLVDGFTPR